MIPLHVLASIFVGCNALSGAVDFKPPGESPEELAQRIFGEGVSAAECARLARASKDLCDTGDVVALQRGLQTALTSDACFGVVTQEPFARALARVAGGHVPGTRASPEVLAAGVLKLFAAMGAWEFRRTSRLFMGSPVTGCTLPRFVPDGQLTAAQVFLYEPVCGTSAVWGLDISSLHRGWRIEFVAAHELGHVLDFLASDALSPREHAESRASLYASFVLECRALWALDQLERRLATETRTGAENPIVALPGAAMDVEGSSRWFINPSLLSPSPDDLVLDARLLQEELRRARSTEPDAAGAVGERLSGLRYWVDVNVVTGQPFLRSGTPPHGAEAESFAVPSARFPSLPGFPPGEAGAIPRFAGALLDEVWCAKESWRALRASLAPIRANWSCWMEPSSSAVPVVSDHAACALAVQGSPHGPMEYVCPK